MLCDVCFCMLRSQEGRIWKGTYDLHFNHHMSGKNLCHSAKMNCGICRVLLEELRSHIGPEKNCDELPITITASLFVPNPKMDQVYCLNLRLRYDQIRCQRTFVLKETSEIPNRLAMVFLANTIYERHQ